jgi:hypothetical protein
MNLPYSKALEMKAAGFPIKEILYFDGVPIEPDLPHGRVIVENLVMPILEEVIAELGHNVRIVDVYNTETKEWGWLAEKNFATFEEKTQAIGETPLEACCNLYLALRKPQE